MSKQHMEKVMVIQPRQNGKKTTKLTSKEGSKGVTTLQSKTVRRLPISLSSRDAVPMIDVMPIVRMSRMYQASGSVNGQFTIASLIQQFMVATSSTNLVPVIDMIRVHRIRAWSNLASSGGEGYVELTPLGVDSANNSFSSPPKTYLDITNSTAYTAHLDVRFTPSLGPSGSWHATANVNTAGTLFQIVGSVNTCWIIDYDCIFGWATAPNNYSSTVSGAAQGSLYTRTPVTNMTPFGVNSI
jgi:hypothetical protein